MFSNKLTSMLCELIEDVDSFNSQNRWRAVIEELVTAPWSLIYIDDKIKLAFSKSITEKLWNGDEFEWVKEYVYNEMIGNLAWEYIDRVKIIKPTFISFDPSIEGFLFLYEETMRSFTFGAYSSSIVMCGAIIESMLESKLEKIEKGITKNKCTTENNEEVKGYLNKLIYLAKLKGLIDKEQEKSANVIRLRRNDVVHSMKAFDKNESYEAICQTRELVESILSESSL